MSGPGFARRIEVAATFDPHYISATGTDKFNLGMLDRQGQTGNS